MHILSGWESIQDAIDLKRAELLDVNDDNLCAIDQKLDNALTGAMHREIIDHNDVEQDYQKNIITPATNTETAVANKEHGANFDKVASKEKWSKFQLSSS